MEIKKSRRKGKGLFHLFTYKTEFFDSVYVYSRHASRCTVSGLKWPLVTLPRISSIPSLSFPPAAARGPFALRRIYTGGLSLGASVYAWDATTWVWGARAVPRETYRTALRFEPFDDEQRNDATQRFRKTLSTGDKKDKHTSPSACEIASSTLLARFAVRWTTAVVCGASAPNRVNVAGKPTGTERSIFRSMSERFVALSWNEIGILAGFFAGLRWSGVGDWAGRIFLDSRSKRKYHALG